LILLNLSTTVPGILHLIPLAYDKMATPILRILPFLTLTVRSKEGRLFAVVYSCDRIGGKYNNARWVHTHCWLYVICKRMDTVYSS
jgi:hypothetical protein